MYRFGVLKKWSWRGEIWCAAVGAFHNGADRSGWEGCRQGVCVGIELVCCGGVEVDRRPRCCHFGVGPECWADGGGDGGNNLTDRIVYTHIGPAAYGGWQALNDVPYDCTC